GHDVSRRWLADGVVGIADENVDQAGSAAEVGQVKRDRIQVLHAAHGREVQPASRVLRGIGSYVDVVLYRQSRELAPAVVRRIGPRVLRRVGLGAYRQRAARNR